MIEEPNLFRDLNKQIKTCSHLADKVQCYKWTWERH